VHFTIHTICEQPTKYNPNITTLVDKNYDNKDDDDDTTGHKVQKNKNKIKNK
jgi:hypothetical protein